MCQSRRRQSVLFQPLPGSVIRYIGKFLKEDISQQLAKSFAASIEDYDYYSCIDKLRYQ